MSTYTLTRKADKGKVTGFPMYFPPPPGQFKFQRKMVEGPREHVLVSFAGTQLRPDYDAPLPNTGHKIY